MCDLRKRVEVLEAKLRAHLEDGHGVRFGEPPIALHPLAEAETAEALRRGTLVKMETGHYTEEQIRDAATWIALPVDGHREVLGACLDAIFARLAMQEE